MTLLRRPLQGYLLSVTLETNGNPSAYLDQKRAPQMLTLLARPRGSVPDGDLQTGPITDSSPEEMWLLPPLMGEDTLSIFL